MNTRGGFSFRFFYHIYHERLKGNWREMKVLDSIYPLVFILNENFVYNLSQKLKEDQFYRVNLKEKSKKKERKKERKKEEMQRINCIEKRDHD